MTGFLICDNPDCKALEVPQEIPRYLMKESERIELRFRSQFHLKASDPGPQFPELEVRYIREKAAAHGWTVIMVDGKPTDWCPDCSGATVSTNFKRSQI